MSNTSAPTATVSSSGGVGFAGLLTVLFIALKLTHVISWSWVWVLSPLWISLAFTLSVLVVLFIVLAIVAAVSK